MNKRIVSRIWFLLKNHYLKQNKVSAIEAFNLAIAITLIFVFFFDPWAFIKPIIDFLFWLDWCAVSYRKEYSFLLGISLVIFHNTKHYIKNTLRASISSWLAYCLMVQGYPAIG